MPLTNAERLAFIRAAAKIDAQVTTMIALASADAPVTQLVLGVNGIKQLSKDLFDDFLADVID